jgi:hypothetical protein
LQNNHFVSLQKNLAIHVLRFNFLKIRKRVVLLAPTRLFPKGPVPDSTPAVPVDGDLLVYKSFRHPNHKRCKSEIGEAAEAVIGTEKWAPIRATGATSRGL